VGKGVPRSGSGAFPRRTEHQDSSGEEVSVVIPPKSNRKVSREYDRELYKLYKWRNLIERTFNKLKHWRRIATRYDRKSLYFLSALYLVSAVTWSL
jgi:transposase